VVDRLDDHVVVERPQGGVGEPLVVLGDVVAAQPDRAELQSVLQDRILGAVDDARPADPRATLLAEQRLKCGDQAAGTALPRGGAVRQPLHVDGQPVGDDHEIGGPGPGGKIGSGVSAGHLGLEL
jgi:hypothetical protein